MAKNTSSRKCNVLLGCTGSVASIKVPQIVHELSAFKHMVCNFALIFIEQLHFLKVEIYLEL